VSNSEGIEKRQNSATDMCSANLFHAKFCFCSFSNISGTLTVEDVYQNREKFASLVREVAAPDVGRMGIEILSFVIKDVVNDVNYLSSIGRAQTAIVKKDAAIGVAEAHRDSGIVVSVAGLLAFCA